MGVDYIATVRAREGHEDAVAEFYQGLEPLLAGAPGFMGRRILRERPGTMAEAVFRLYPPEELAGHGGSEHDHASGVHFVILERWESVDARMNFSRSVSGERMRALIPHLEPEHSHEFYEDVSPED